MNKISIFFSGVGKSSLIKQYICDLSPLGIAPTIGASFSTFKIKLEQGKVKMQIWDTAGFMITKLHNFLFILIDFVFAGQEK